MMKKSKLKTEKRILKLSFVGSILFVLAEGIMAWLTHSHSLLTDCLFDAADLIMKYSVLLALTCDLLVENVKLLFKGGHYVDAGSIAIFEFLVCLGCAGLYLTLNHYSKKYESDTIKAELYMWKLDIVSSMGVAVAFTVQTMLLHTKLHFVAPFIDPAVAAVMALFLIREPIKVIFQSIRNLVLFAPEKDVFDQIYAIVDKHMQEYPYEVTFLDVIQTGRKSD